tara:strand:- start:8007 stop:8813 length:807 start_codon:yes stop_codon:yes gene_type:complete
MSIQFLESDFDKVSYLQNLLSARATGIAADDGEFEQLRHELLSNPKVANLLPQWLRHHGTLDSFWGYIKPMFSTYAERRTYLSKEFSPLLDALEFGNHPLADLPSPSSSLAQNTKSSERNKRKVFIVHGHDNEAKQEVARFIESLGLQTIILHEQASAGMTIIEKIERYSTEADFALVLYTACDQGRGMNEKNMPPKDRARQNVVFEHGYLMAKLGRENVCSLVKRDIEKPNDISGVVYVPMDSPGAWKTEVKKELVACGYKLKNLPW